MPRCHRRRCLPPMLARSGLPKISWRNSGAPEGEGVEAAAAERTEERLVTGGVAVSAAAVGRSIVMALAKRRHIPERSCVACGKKVAKSELIRIVRTPEGDVMVDSSGKRPGRGAYLCRASLCWQKSVHKARLERSLEVTLSAHDRLRLMASYQEMVAKPSPVER